MPAHSSWSYTPHCPLYKTHNTIHNTQQNPMYSQQQHSMAVMSSKLCHSVIVLMLSTGMIDSIFSSSYKPYFVNKIDQFSDSNLISSHQKSHRLPFYR